MQVSINSPSHSRTVRIYPRRDVYSDYSDFFKTEVVDAADFDGLEDVSVRFEAIQGPDAPPAGCSPFRVGDVVFVGWYVE